MFVKENTCTRCVLYAIKIRILIFSLVQANKAFSVMLLKEFLLGVCHFHTFQIKLFPQYQYICGNLGHSANENVSLEHSAFLF